MRREDALRGYIRSSKAWDLMDSITTSDDPVWAEDEFIRDVLAHIDRTVVAHSDAPEGSERQ